MIVVTIKIKAFDLKAGTFIIFSHFFLKKIGVRTGILAQTASI
jgi:hypothetical protein